MSDIPVATERARAKASIPKKPADNKGGESSRQNIDQIVSNENGGK